MLLKYIPTSDLVEALNLKEVFDPFMESISIRTQAGEDTMDKGMCKKSDLVFPSGEPLPRCWRDSHYRKRVTA